jgi:hypothetical protein
MCLKVEGFRKIGSLIEHIIRHGKSLFEFTLPFEKTDFVYLARKPILQKCILMPRAAKAIGDISGRSAGDKADGYRAEQTC